MSSFNCVLSCTFIYCESHEILAFLFLALVITCLGGRFGINHEGGLSPKWPELNMWLPVNHTNPKTTVLKLISFNSGQLQNNSVNGATLATINRVVMIINWFYSSLNLTL